MKNFFLVIFCSLFVARGIAAELPRSAGYDNRMQQVSYNAYNATVVNAKLGFLTSLIFDDSEDVISAKSGFEAGWDISFDSNVVYVLPRPVVQEQQNEEGNKEQKVFEPIPDQWKTNLLIRTSKRVYSVELNMLDESDKRPNSYVVKYNYPQEMATKRIAEETAKKKELEANRNKKMIAERFERADAPKNWNYSMRVNDKSESRKIAPDFAYDNGIFTYLGFSSIKTFPAAFLYKNGKEQVLNFSVETKGKYKVMVIHNINDKFVLRYGNSVVGIVNSAFGQIIENPKNTISSSVDRVEVKND